MALNNSRKSASKVASGQKALKCFASQGRAAVRSGVAVDVALFLLKVAALETVRRISRARCPFVWRGLQALQILCYLPFRWIQRWASLKTLVKPIRMFSRPFLVLSVATAFSDLSEQTSASCGLSDSNACSGLDSASSSVQPSVDTRAGDKAPDHLPSENWLLNLYEELKNQGISIPERFYEKELHRFYTAANGDFSTFLSTVKKTIHWRKTYNILSEQELELWSHVVFWHGYDVRHRPCLIVRLGLACISLPTHERPQFVQAIVSQVEYGILHFVDEENPQITVLVDCEGLSPIRLPMQMMSSSSALFQDHFPNHLGCLFVIRIPPDVWEKAQTFIQILRPATQRKLKFVGETYQEVLSEYLQVLPAYLGGKCLCTKCSSVHDMRTLHTTQMSCERQPNADISDGVYLPCSSQIDINMDHNCDQVLRTAIMAILMILVFIALAMWTHDPESLPFPLP
ncbi:hypothetical protein Nepgr_009258 [Nepenthes gracilis]|uniref:CRAL-TRIO domain-containing protein n=1 Tax=Nepenthes gracilis TaxID=150966 RepID=A0AAD3SA93_NEPGR|nr:hypothetical protein Nepgr_009258 [Nepenthes gracilis]